jgi:hypothetical protein
LSRNGFIVHPNDGEMPRIVMPCVQPRART